MREGPSYAISFYFRRILVPVDGSETSLKALLVAADFAQRYGSRITVVYAKPKGFVEAEDPLAKAKERLKDVSVDVVYKQLEYDHLSDSPQSALLREILSGGYDLVIIGARGKTALSEANIGGVALFLATNAPVSLFIVR
ncbi:MAG: universal stress protein [Desulfurococcaceae archaeon]